MAEHSIPIKVFDFQIETAFGPLPKLRVEVKNAPMRLSDIVPWICNIAGKIISLAASNSQKQGKPVTCGPHCSACCHQLVPLSAPEAIYIVELLLAMPYEQRFPILKRFEDMGKKIAKAGLNEKIREGIPDGNTNELSREYFSAGIACPFLVDDSCSIHENRPIACREYNVTSDPKLCKSPFDGSIQILALQRRLTMRLHELAVQLCGISPGNIVFPLIFDWYDTHRELASRTWPGPELFELMLDLTMGSSGS